MSEELVKRLRAEQPIGMLSGCMDTVRPINPDGPEAADTIGALTARIAQLEAELAGARERDADAYSLLRRIRTWGVASTGFDSGECRENTTDVDAMMKRLTEARAAQERTDD